MSDYCPDCGDVHPSSQPCQDAAAQTRRLERLKKREIEALEAMAASQNRGLIMFPIEGLKLLPAIITAHPRLGAAEIGGFACDIIDVYLKEAAKRWGMEVPRHV